MPFLEPGHWSRKHECCVVCKTTDEPHAAKGMCRRCYHTSRYIPVADPYKRGVEYQARVDEVLSLYAEGITAPVIASRLGISVGAAKSIIRRNSNFAGGCVIRVVTALRTEITALRERGCSWSEVVDALALPFGLGAVYRACRALGIGGQDATARHIARSRAKWPIETVRECKRLVDSGLLPVEASRKTGVPRSTIQDWIEAGWASAINPVERRVA